MKGIVLDPATREAVPAVVRVWTRDGRVPLVGVPTAADGTFELGPIAGEVILRVHTADERGRLLEVVQLAELPDSLVVWADPAAFPLFLSGVPADATTVWTDDLVQHDVRYGGRLRLPSVPAQPVRLWLDDRTMVADLKPDPRLAEQRLTFTEAAPCVVSGTVTGYTGSLRLELLDGGARWPNPVASADISVPGEFRLTFGRLLAVLPQPMFALWAGNRRLALTGSDATWDGTTLAGVRIDLREASGDYTLDGQALRRDTRAPAAGLRIELWAADLLAGVTTSDLTGRFGFTFAAGPPVTLRIWEGARRLPDIAVPAGSWTGRHATVFAEIGPAESVPSERRVYGRVLDPATRRPVPGLRVEMWDQAARPGGLAGVATIAAADGTFDVALPVPDAARPTVFFRLYAGDVLAATLEPPVHWDATGAGSVLLEVAADAGGGGGEVLLHELGETVAGAVDRMQQELSRYPSTLGAYVVDDLDLTVPVAVRLDRLGQARAQVVDRAPAGEQLGSFRMRVRPVLGARQAPADRLDQPLTVLTELTADAVARLTALRIYSVEDLVRLATAPAGRDALERLGLDVDLDRLLDKAVLLSTAALPVAVRGALLRLGVDSVPAFLAYTDRAGLASALTTDLGQPITAGAVRAWQDEVSRATRIVLPSPPDQA